MLSTFYEDFLTSYGLWKNAFDTLKKSTLTRKSKLQYKYQIKIKRVCLPKKI